MLNPINQWLTNRKLRGYPQAIMALPVPLKIGTRASILATTQTALVMAALRHVHAGWQPENTLIPVPLVTTGDKITQQPLYDIGGKALFCKELDQALLDGTIDIAVHSMKDVPTIMPPRLVIAAVLPRADCRDALICRTGLNWDSLRTLPAPRIGTCSLRRTAQIRALLPGAQCIPLRGNVPTRLAKVQEGDFDGIILAMAGLERLNRSAEACHVFEPQTLIPAAGQGIIGIICRKEDTALIETLQNLSHQPSYQALLAERAMLTILQGNCRAPIGAWAEMLADGQLCLRGLVADASGAPLYRTMVCGKPDDALQLGWDAARSLIAQAGDAFIDKLRSQSS